MHFSNWRKLLIDPKSKNVDGRRREFILNILLASSTIAGILAFVVVIVRSIGLGSSYAGEPPLFAALQVSFFAGLWVLSRKGYFVPAAYALVGIFFMLSFYIMISFGIFLAQGVLLLALVLVMASVLLGTRTSVFFALLVSVGLIVLSALQQNGTLRFDSSWMKIPAGPNDAVGFSLTLIIITVVFWLSNREIERFNITLQERVTEATAHLRTANQKLKVLDKAKDDFISMASHQLGTPLTAVTGYLSMALEEDKGNLSVGQREYVSIALESSERLVSMASDLLNVSRLNAGRFNIIQQPTDLAGLIKAQILQLRSSAERKNLALEFTPPEKPLPLIPLDESKTSQVIMNFIDNAIYYTEKGSVKVTLERAGRQAILKVIDTGMGVPPAEKAKLFAKFYRADNAKSVRPDGTGLGLYLAKRVIEDQGGEIIFESTLGEGSTFGFKLPLVAQVAAKTASAKDK